MKTWERRIMEAKSVYIFHECGGYYFWAVDMPGTKREISRALNQAMRRNERVEYMEAHERPATSYCKCFQIQAIKPLIANGAEGVAGLPDSAPIGPEATPEGER